MDTEELRCLEEGRRIFEGGTYGMYVAAQIATAEENLTRRIKSAKTWREFLEFRAQLQQLEKINAVLSLMDITN